MNDALDTQPPANSKPDRNRQRRTAYALLLPLPILALSVCFLFFLFDFVSRHVDRRSIEILEVVAILVGMALPIALFIALVLGLVGLVYVVRRRRTLNDPVLFALAGLFVLVTSALAWLLLLLVGRT